MTVDELSLIAGTILSLGFSYIPGLNTRFSKLAPEYKRLIMLGLVIVTAIGIYAISCLNLDFGVGVACSREGIVSLIRLVILAAVANQGTYSLTKK